MIGQEDEDAWRDGEKTWEESVEASISDAISDWECALGKNEREELKKNEREPSQSKS